VESIAGGCGTQTVVFLRVVEPFYVNTDYFGAGSSAEQIVRINADNKTAAENYLKKLLERTKYKGSNVQWEVITGKAAETISDYAAKNSFDLITIATHGRSGVSRWVWGSVADRILRSTCVPVLMIRAPGCGTGI
jgi:nucleotide-binding universal stress UspA family protein